MQCRYCGGRIPRAALRTIRVASDADLRSPRYLADLKTAVAGLGLPRRVWRDAIADAVRDHDGMILTPVGGVYAIPEIDEHFPDDPDQRWMSAFASTGRDRHAGRLQRRVLERVRLVDLFFRLRHPALAATFGRSPANDNAASRTGEGA